MKRSVKRIALVLAMVAVVTSLGIVVDAKVSSTTPRWITATRDWAASGVTPGSSGPLTTLRRMLARSLSPAAAQGKSASIETDDVNYLPKSKVVVSGSGFMPGEIVEVTFAEQLIPGGYVDAPVIVDETADHKGSFVNRDYKTDDHHANIKIVVTAKGLVSGATATTTIGDGAIVTTDLKRYSVGAGMIISGAGFTPDATMTISILRPDHETDTIAPAPQTDHNGTFSVRYNPPPVSGRYKITATDGVNTALTAATEADAVALGNDQCLNGTAAAPNNCAVLGGGNGWASGNANANKAHYVEGDSIVYRSVVTGTGASSGTHINFAVSVSWDTRSNSRNAIDYITYPVRAGFGETVNPCDGVGATDSTGAAIASCLLPKLGSGLPLPSGVTAFDFNSSIGPSGTTPLQSVSLSGPTTTGTFLPTMPADSWTALRTNEPGYTDGGDPTHKSYTSSAMVIAGGTITGIRYPAAGQDPLAGASATTRIVIYIDVYSNNFVMSFSGHIGSRLEWGLDSGGVPNSAGGISGSPYHLHQDGVCSPTTSPTDCTTGAGSADLQLAAGAIAAPTHLTLVKVVSGGSALPTDWTLTATGPSVISGTSGSATVTNASVNPGAYTLSESTGPAGYTAGTYSCVKNGGAPVVSNSLTLIQGDDATCTVTNTALGSIVLVKNTHGGDGSFAFTTTGGGGLTNTTLTTVGGTKAQTYTSISSGVTYSITEVMPTGWQQGAATVCSSGTSAGFTVASGQTVTCTFDNTKQSTIVLVKNTTGGDGSFAFTTTGGGGFSNTTLTTSGGTKAQTYTNVDPTKTFSVTEAMPTGWQQGAATTCTTGTSASFTVTAGGSTTCTFSNTKQASIVLVKNTHGGDGSFAFTTTGGGGFSNTTLTTSGGTAAQTYSNVDPTKTFSVTEAMPAGWQQGAATTCSSGTAASFTVAAGTTVTCTFDNTKQSTIVLVKNTHGGDGSFAFTTTGGGGFSNTTLTTSGGTAAQTYSNVDPTKTFSVTEAMPAGWQQGAATTCSSGTAASFTVAAGTTVTCTFDNTKQSTIVLVKNTHGGDGSFAFTTTGGGNFSNTTLTTSASTAAQTYNNVDPTKTFSVTEAMPTGWQQGLAPSCTTGTNTSFTVAAGGTTTCTFDNTKQSSIVLVKNTHGGDGSFAFTTTGGGGFSNTTLTTSASTATQTYTNVDPTKTFSVSETMPTGWQQGLAPVCTGGGNTPASFTVTAGGTTTCTFDNTKQSTLILVKNTIGGNGSFAFTTTGGGGFSNTTLTTAGNTAAQTYNNVDPTKTFSVTEAMPTGWQQGAATTCTTGTNTSFTVAAGGTTTCTFSNTKQSTIVLVKSTIGGDGSFAFTTTGGGGLSNTTLTTSASTATQTFSNIDPTKTFSIAESTPAGWEMTNSTCTSGTPASFTVAAGGSVTCTFTNQKLSGIILVKNTHGGNGSFAFTTTNLGGGTTTLTTVASTASQTYTNVDPDFTYNFSETMPTGWQQGLAPNCVGQATGNVGNFTIAAGTTVTCTFDNVKQSTLILVKNTHGGDGSFAFTTTGGGGFSNTTLTTAGNTAAQTYTNVDPTKTFSVTEAMPTGWQTGLATTCTTGTNASFTVAAGGTTTCTFDNTKQSTIVLVKNTHGGDGSFAFTTTGGGGFSNTTLTTASGTKAQTYTNVDPTKTFGVTEAMPAGWQIGLATTCTTGTNTAFTVAAGGTTTCTFDNTKLSTIILVKNTIGGNGSFVFTTTGGGGFSNTTLTTVGGTKSQTYSNVDPTHTFSVTEAMPSGWTAGAATTCTTGTNTSFTVAAGGTTTCTFTNSLNPQITLFKTVSNSFGGASTTDFTMTGDGPTPISFPGFITSGPNFQPGTYTLGETNRTGYLSGIWSCIANNGTPVFNIGSPAAFNAAITSLSPIAFWRFNELGGSTLADATGHGHTLTMPETDLNAPGAIGGTTTGLATTNSRARMTPISLPAGPLTFEWWLAPQVQGGDTYGTLFEDSQNFGNGFYLKDNGAGKVNLTAYVFADQLNTTAMNTDGTVYHVVAAVDGAGNGVFYVNGVADGTFTYGALNLDRIFNNEAPEPLQVSLIDEVAIYPSRLTAGAISTHYTQGIANAPATYQATVLAASPTAYWKFDETSGTTLADASGNGHTLTIPSVTFGVIGDTIGSTGLAMTNGVAGMTPISLPVGSPLSFSWVIKPLVQGGDGYGTLLEDNGNFGNGFYLQDNGAGKVWLNMYNFGDQHNNTPLNTDGTLYHVIASITAGGVGTWYVNGVADGTFTYGGLNADRAFQNDAYEALHVSLIDRMAIFPVAVSGAQALSQYSLATAKSTVTVGPGDVATCQINNSDELAHLKLVKSVNNDNGGTLVAADFWLAANGPTPFFGKGVVESNVFEGVYRLRELTRPGYTAGAWSCNAGSLNGNLLTLTAGQNATCTIINNDAPPTLTLVKQVVNTHGGTALASAWTVTANGGGLGSVTGQGFATSGPSFKAGTYALSESGGVAGYTASAWVCVGGTQNGASITIGLAQNVTCTITNSDQAPSLTLVKQVSNTHGGSAVAANWLLSASAGPTPISGQGGAVSDGTFQQGTYFLSESGGPNGYTAGAWNCTGTGSQNGSNITLGLGQSATCTIINSDIAPILTLVKSVCNDNGGTATASNFLLSATGGPTPISGQGGVISGGAFIAGTYALAESGGPAGYSASAWHCDGGSQNGSSITIGIGQAATCAIDNDDIAPTLTLVKQVSNTHGGSAVPSNWLLRALGPTSVAGQGGVTSGSTFYAGTYSLEELGGPATYVAGTWSCTNGVVVTAGQITLPLAKVTTCTIINSDVAATLIVKKVVINDNNGTGVASNFSFKVNGGSTTPFTGSGSTSSVTMTVNAGTYNVVENAAPGYGTTYSNCANLILFNGATGTCTITNNDNPPGPVTFLSTAASFAPNAIEVPVAHKANGLTFYRP